MARYKREFFERSAEIVAQELLGSFIHRRLKSGKILKGRIVETEAYLGEEDQASHARRGKTKRSRTMYGPAGRAYIYLVYGLHWMLNVVTGPEGEPGAVLFRALEPFVSPSVPVKSSFQRQRRLGSGPGRLTSWLVLNEKDNGVDMVGGDELWLEKGEGIIKGQIVVSARIGVDYAGSWAKKPLRFYLSDNGFVSKR